MKPVPDRLTGRESAGQLRVFLTEALDLLRDVAHRDIQHNVAWSSQPCALEGGGRSNETVCDCGQWELTEKIERFIDRCEVRP